MSITDCVNGGLCAIVHSELMATIVRLPMSEEGSIVGDVVCGTAVNIPTGIKQRRGFFRKGRFSKEGGGGSSGVGRG